jgi:hypothetical protein
VVQVAVTSDSPSNQYLFVSHEKTNGTGHPIYVRVSTSNTDNVAIPTNTGAYGVCIPPGAMFVFTGPQCSSSKTVYVTAISETDSPEVYVTPGEGL